ncbi:unnamed protein product [Dovyalis caffra]|uniref:Uncharacterized protein n=1 Tax=Dovyalis caffra TaxID=77055 RepID=A0AAV1S4I5_9ROSI|nr:unnamed protein product [Dovyalis caffra]
MIDELEISVLENRGGVKKTTIEEKYRINPNLLISMSTEVNPNIIPGCCGDRSRTMV